MKKTLLLSVVASTMIMAGGDIAPVEPVIVEEVSAWEFGGDLIAYTQTRDNFTATGNVPNSITGSSSSLFGGTSTSGLLGLSLRAANKDLFAGIGFGAELSALGNGYNNGYSASPGKIHYDPTIGLYQNAPIGARGNFGLQHGNAITQAYLTYGMDSISTSAKVGRQHLPKSLSPFAFTEGWQAIKNSFDAALIVNSSLPDTAAVYAYVAKANRSVGDISDFNQINPANKGVHMVTLQNKSIDSLTMTGTWYYAPDYITALNIPTPIVGLPYTESGDVNVLWGDVAYAGEYFGAAVQGGQISPDSLKNTNAWGAKVTGNLSMFSLLAAYSSVNDGAVDVYNLGTRVKSPLYTQAIANQNVIRRDSDSLKLAAGMKALGGKFGLAYMYSDLDNTANASTFTVGGPRGGSGSYSEVDVSYKTKVGEDLTLFAAYVYQQDKRDVLVDPVTLTPVAFSKKSETQNFVRFWARYNFN